MNSIPGYRLKEHLYQSEYAAFYMADNKSTGRKVLVKLPAVGVSLELFTAETRREREITAMLGDADRLAFRSVSSGPNTVLLEADPGDMIPLRAFAGGRRLSTGTFLALASLLAGTVSRFHRRGVVNLGLNPKSMLADPQLEKVLVFDFSRAQRFDDEAAGERLPGYMSPSRDFLYLAPEQTGGLNRPPGPRVDVYSLGVMLYELATGVLPVATEDPLKWFHTLMAGTIKPPHELNRELPPAVSGVIMKCLNREPEDRYPDAGGVKNDIEECLTQWRQKGRLERSPEGRRYTAPVWANTGTGRDQSGFQLNMIPFLIRRRMYREAIAMGLRGLEELGFPVPQSPSRLHLLQLKRRVERLLAKTGIDRLPDLPPGMDAEKRNAVDLAYSICICACQQNQNLMILLALKAGEISLQYGRADDSGAAYMAMAIVYMHGFKDYNTGLSLAGAARKITEKSGNDHDRYTTGLLYGTFILPWVRPVRDSERYLAGLVKEPPAALDPAFSINSMVWHIISLYASGAPLQELLDYTRDYSLFLHIYKDRYFSCFLSIYRQFSLALQGFTETPSALGDARFDEDEFYNEITTTLYLKRELFDYCLCKGHLCYLAGEYRQSFDWLEKADRLTSLYFSEVYLVDYHFYYCLAALAIYPRLKPVSKAALRVRLRAKMSKLRYWARQCPANFEHKYLLVTAEAARVHGKGEKAVLLYDRAARLAGENGFVHDSALVCECAAGFYLAEGLFIPAGEYLRAARDGYRTWGAIAKVEQLNARYPWLEKTGEKIIRALEKNSGAPGPDLSRMVDMSAVYQAAGAISGSIVLEELMQKMMTVMMQNAGADMGCFLLQKDGLLHVEAVAGNGPDGIDVKVLSSVPLGQFSLAPASIINHCASTDDIIVLDDAVGDERFKLNRERKMPEHLSVMCLPVTRRGRLLGLLYLENSTAAGCFHPGRVETLKLLCSQLAISLENAMLYHSLQQMNINLEDKVRERTASLVAVQKETLNALLEKSRLEERNRIAREVHDTVGHTLTSVLVQVEAGKRLIPKNITRAMLKLEQSQAKLRAGLQEIRDSFHLLKDDTPAGVMDLEKLVQDIIASTGVDIDYRIDVTHGLDQARKYVLYRALQEGVTNGIRHGDSKQFQFSLLEENGWLRFTLSDSGSGAGEIRFGFGLTSMRERVAELGGRLAVHSRPGEGCRIEITLPAVERQGQV